MQRILLTAALLALAACASSPEAAKANRDALIRQVFPNPADQSGLDLAFPVESGGLYKIIEIAFFPAEVSEATVRKRVSGFCLRQGSDRLTGQVAVRKDAGLSVRTTLEGQKKQVHTIWYRCVERG